MQTRPELRSRISNAAQPSSAASSSSAAPAPAQQGLQPVVLPSFGGLPPQIGMMPVGAPAFGGCLMAVPGPPSTAPQNSETPSTATAGAAAPKAKASAEAQREANTFEVPVRGQDVPRPQRGRSQSTAPQRASSSRGYYDAGQGVIWHQDRSGRYWSSAARDDQRKGAQHGSWQGNWWWDDRDWWSWSHTPHSNWSWGRDAWRSATRDSPRHSPAPQAEQVHGNVLREGWQASLLVDRSVLHEGAHTTWAPEDNICAA